MGYVHVCPQIPTPLSPPVEESCLHPCDHQVGCGGNGDRIARHNAIRDALFAAAQSAALGPKREASGVVPDSNSRPADVYLPTWHHG